MSLKSVRDFFATHAPDLTIMELDDSTATVELAARGLGVEPAQIAKTLAVRVGDDVVLIVAAGTARLDNKKVKAHFGTKPRMLGLDEVVAETGHPVGGVCPFGLARPLRIACDVTLRQFDHVFPAAGDIHAAVKIAPERMAMLVGAEWADLCQ